MLQFSIVITTYNRLTLLQRAVESALNQSLACEVVIVDDGSSDGTEDYVKSLGNRVVYHRNSSNLGHAVSVNKGVIAAQGNWIKLIDDDDYLAPDCLQKMAEAIAYCPQAVICSCLSIQVNSKGSEISRANPRGSKEAFYVVQEDIHYGMLMEMLPFGTPVQVAFTKEAFLNSGGWNSDFNLKFDDIESWLKIAQYGDAVFINQYLAYKTIWNGNGFEHISLQTKLETNILIKQKIYQFVHPKYHSSLPKIEDISAFLKLHWGLVSLKQGKILTALKISDSSLFSPAAWLHLTKVIYARKIKPSWFKIEYQEIMPSLISAR